jgi:hypothetical protein
MMSYYPGADESAELPARNAELGACIAKTNGLARLWLKPFAC